MAVVPVVAVAVAVVPVVVEGATVVAAVHPAASQNGVGLL